MMRKESLSKKLSNNILTLSQVAAQAKKDNPNVINATIGMLNDSSDKFYTFKAVSEVMKEFSYYEYFSYADTDGGEKFKDAILKWVFGNYLQSLFFHLQNHSFHISNLLQTTYFHSYHMYFPIHVFYHS